MTTTVSLIYLFAPTSHGPKNTISAKALHSSAPTVAHTVSPPRSEEAFPRSIVTPVTEPLSTSQKKPAFVSQILTPVSHMPNHSASPRWTSTRMAGSILSSPTTPFTTTYFTIKVENDSRKLPPFPALHLIWVGMLAERWESMSPPFATTKCWESRSETLPTK